MQATVSNIKVLDAAGESEDTALPLNSLAQRFDDSREPIAAEVRPVVVKNGRLPFTLGQQLENLADVGSGAAASKLAVAESAGPPFAEKIITFWIKWAARVKDANVLNPVSDGPASFQNDGAVSLLGKKIRCYHPGRTSTDDNRRGG